MTDTVNLDWRSDMENAPKGTILKDGDIDLGGEGVIDLWVDGKRYFECYWVDADPRGEAYETEGWYDRDDWLIDDAPSHWKIVTVPKVSS